MNPRAWLSSTLAHHIEARGEILAPWEDVDETAIPVRTLAAFAPLWRTEEERADVRVERPTPLARWVERDCEAIVGVMVPGEVVTTAMIEARLPHLSPMRVRERMLDLWAAGRVVRATGRGYRLV